MVALTGFHGYIKGNCQLILHVTVLRPLIVIGHELPVQSLFKTNEATVISLAHWMAKLRFSLARSKLYLTQAISCPVTFTYNMYM